MISEHINKIEDTISKSNGFLVFKQIDSIMNQWLYEFSNGLYLYIVENKIESYPQYEIKLGKLKMINDKKVCVFVLENINIYLTSLYKLKLIDKKLIIHPNLALSVDILINNLNLIITNYNSIVKEESFINNVRRLENLLKKYEVKEIDTKVLNELVKKDNLTQTIYLDIKYTLKQSPLNSLNKCTSEVVFSLIVIILMVIIFILDIFTDIDISSFSAEVIILMAILASLLIMLPIVIIFSKKKKE